MTKVLMWVLVQRLVAGSVVDLDRFVLRSRSPCTDPWVDLCCDIVAEDNQRKQSKNLASDGLEPMQGTSMLDTAGILDLSAVLDTTAIRDLSVKLDKIANLDTAAAGLAGGPLVVEVVEPVECAAVAAGLGGQDLAGFAGLGLAGLARLDLAGLLRLDLAEPAGRADLAMLDVLAVNSPEMEA
jgi:hypothetical protein